MVGNNLLDKNSASVRKNIENHAFTDEGGDEYGGSRFGGFADYFQNKQIKLQNRDAQLRSSAKDKPQFFKGIVVHVVGYVQPSTNDLHDMLVQHGAGWLQYLSGKTMATHIIASSMPPKKVVELANYRVVKPAWVVDSVAAGRMLPWTDYRVIEEGPKQRTIKFDAGKMLSSQPRQQTPQRYREQTENSFYTSQLKKFSSPAQPKTPFKFPSATVNDIIEDFEDDMSVDLLQAPASSKSEPLAPAEPDAPSNQRPDTPPYQAPYEASPEARPATPDIAEPLNVEPESAEPEKHEEIQPVKLMTSEEHNARLLADPKMRKASTANPDFLKQYYSESRLHHLSTWKAQLKSRMQSLAAEKGPAKKSAKRPAGSRRYIMHVDFDSFFCAVSLKKAPEYHDKPAVVAHGNGSGSEIASCNYPARKFGVKNGMWMKRALELCPDLKILPYDFPGYEEASRQFYDAILETGGVVQSVSIDETLIDVTDIVMAEAGSKGVGISEGSIWGEQEKVDQMALKLRERIKEKTDCHVSVGIGGNILLAKVALRKAKPAGQYQIKPEEVLDFLGELKVEDLPGVAYSIGAKLEELGIKFVKDIRQTSKEKLVSALGPKTGEKLWEYSRGIDRAEVGEQPIRKSVSADVNWGIRFINQEEAEDFVRNLSQELERRLLNEGVKGKHLTIKIMRRAADAPLDPPKHLGHGKCDTFNKSVSFGVATNSGEVIGKEAVAILRSYKFSPGDLRGLGVQMTKLEPLKPSAAPQGSQKRLSFGAAGISSAKKRKAEAIDDDEPQSPGKHRSSSTHNEKDPITADPLTPRKPKGHPALHLARAGEADEKAKTPLNVRGTQFIMPSQLDPSVLAELPEDIRSKILDQMKAQPNRCTDSKPPQPVSGKSLPNHAEIPPDIDLEVFNALPPEMQAEVLASYRRNTAQAGPSRQPQPQGGGGGGGGQTLLPQSPRKDRIINRPVDRLRTLTKRSRGRPPAYLKEKERDLKAGLRQASLITATRPQNQGQGQGQGQGQSPGDYSRQSSVEIDLPPLDPDFLSELPEDVRREVIEDHARQRRQLERQAQEAAAAAQQQEH
ncbi:deoxycytidyl transferase, partial [Neurospora sp. IMI 360204]